MTAHAPRIRNWIATAAMAVASVGCMVAQQPAASETVPVTMVVSVEAKHGKEIPTIYPDDVRVFHDRDRLKVQSWIPCQGGQGGLELFLVIDDASDSTLGLQFKDLQKFIDAQPPTTVLALGYIREGSVQVVQNFTRDHALVAKALRLPLGAGVLASPYTAVSDLVKRWPESGNCHEIVLISPGLDALQPGVTDTYLDEAIAGAQRAGVQVYSIYAASAGHFGHTFWRTSIAQSNLSRLTDETGGEAYFQGLEMPIAFAPYLNQFAERLQHQFKLTFLAKPGRKSELQSIKLETEVPNADLVAADQVWVPAVR
jgi:hypothetical protein